MESSTVSRNSPPLPNPPLQNRRALHHMLQHVLCGTPYTVQLAVSIVFGAVDVEDFRLHVRHQAGVVIILIPRNV